MVNSQPKKDWRSFVHELNVAKTIPEKYMVLGDHLGDNFVTSFDRGVKPYQDGAVITYRWHGLRPKMQEALKLAQALESYLERNPELQCVIHNGRPHSGYPLNAKVSEICHKIEQTVPRLTKRKPGEKVGLDESKKKSIALDICYLLQEHDAPVTAYEAGPAVAILALAFELTGLPYLSNKQIESYLCGARDWIIGYNKQFPT